MRAGVPSTSLFQIQSDCMQPPDECPWAAFVWFPCGCPFSAPLQCSIEWNSGPRIFLVGSRAGIRKAEFSSMPHAVHSCASLAMAIRKVIFWGRAMRFTNFVPLPWPSERLSFKDASRDSLTFFLCHGHPKRLFFEDATCDSLMFFFCHGDSLTSHASRRHSLPRPKQQKYMKDFVAKWAPNRITEIE